MTSHKHLKQLVRARMEKTGERYASARRQVARGTTPAAENPIDAHRPGRVPAATALRILFNHAGLDLSEPVTFALAGGIGAGVFAFLYEKEDFASLFLAGRHAWHDEKGYLTHAAKRLGFTPMIKEAGGAGPAEKNLRSALEAGRPVIAWVDAGHLPHRAMPTTMSGAAYHLVTVYAVDGDTALLGDLGPKPVEIPLAELTRARGRIKKDKYRLLWVEGEAPPAPSVVAAFKAGIAHGAKELATCRMKNFRLDAFRDLADRMEGKKGKESWTVMFPPGHRMWTALTSLYEYVEHYGTGGGLCRTIMAEGLAEGARRFKMPGLAPIAGRYAELGRAWSALANAALPDAVPACREAKSLISRRAALVRSGGKPAEIAECWRELHRLGAEARKRFPMSDTDAQALRHALRERLLAIHSAEVVALEALSAV
jgi:hypothetical protein